MSKLKEWFFVSESDGHLYDTRKPEWHKGQPLRKEYALVKPDVRRNTIAVRAAIRQGYAWPGGYALVAYTWDGQCLCMQCCKDNYRLIAMDTRADLGYGWNIRHIASSAELENYETCDNCGKAIDGYHELNEQGHYTYADMGENG